MLLEFDWPANYDKEDFYLDKCNEKAFIWLNSIDFWQDPQTLLVGPRYSGKTHLATIWMSLLGAIKLTNDKQSFSINPLLIDEVDEYDEDYLLEISNRYENSGIPILWCTNRHPDKYNLFTNDLRTRLCSLTTFEIEEPSEWLFKKIIKKRCIDIGLDIGDECIQYSCKYLELTYLAINNFITKLNFICLKKQRQPSICLINDILSR